MQTSAQFTVGLVPKFAQLRFYHNLNWHQPVPAGEKVEEGGADEAGGGGCEDAPGGLDEQGIRIYRGKHIISYLDEEGVGHGGDHVDQAVQDDEDVHSVSILPQNACTGPEVDDQCDHCEWNVCKKVTHRVPHVHLQ